MKIVAIIPSRYGSSRLIAKPLMKIKKIPMIQRVYERVRQAKSITDVFVATDDRRIADVVEGFGGRAVMTTAENRSGTDRVAEAAAKIGLSDSDIVVNVQGDQPLIEPSCLDEVVVPFYRIPDLTMTTLAYTIVDPREITNPKDCKVTFGKDGFALYFSRSPIPCARDAGTRFDTYKHLGIYAYTVKFLKIFSNLPTGRLESIEKLEQNRVLENGYRILVVITEHDSPEVDVPEDIERIESILNGKR